MLIVNYFVKYILQNIVNKVLCKICFNAGLGVPFYESFCHQEWEVVKYIIKGLGLSFSLDIDCKQISSFYF